jgi:hypothetical protein
VELIEMILVIAVDVAVITAETNSAIICITTMDTLLMKAMPLTLPPSAALRRPKRSQRSSP